VRQALTPVVTPAWGDTACDWSSDDERIAAVDENGVITGVAAGETIIRAKTESGCEAQAQIRVYKPVEEIRLTQGTTNLTLNVVDHPTMQIDAAAYPEDATHKDFSYESDNEAVVSVSDTGVMTVQGAGKATVTISARYTSGEPVTLPLQVTVVPYDFSGETLPEVSPMTYTGSVLTPSLSFMIGDRYLWKNTDYTMTNNGTSSLGQHTYTITGMGLFTGTLTGTYEIVEMRPTLSYSGNTIFEYGSVSLNPSSNALSKVKYKYALASDPQTWITGRPKEVGEYIQQFYIPDSYGVIGCEVLVNIRIVNSFAKEVTASAKTIHLYAGQTVDVKIGFVLEEGVTYFNPTMYVSTVDENGVIASASMRTSDTKYLRLITAASAEGEAEVTVYRYGKATDEVRIKVYVHPNPQTFRLPMIAQVEEEAFVNTSANVIRLEGKQVSIGARAFKDSAALWQVVLPKGEAVVAPDALEGTEAVLVCPSFNSQAAISAQESGLPYVAGN